MGYFRAFSSTSALVVKLAPRNFAGIPDSGMSELSWRYCQGAVKHTLYWGLTPGITKQSNVIEFDSIITSYVHTGLTNNTTYYYKLMLTDVFGNESDLSDEVSVTPAILIPPDFNVRGGDEEVVIYWDAVPIAEKYTIYWDTTSGVTAMSDSIVVDASVISYTHDDSILNGRAYYYRMSSQDANGNNSVLSLEKMAWTDSINISDSAPNNVVTTAGTNEIVITWDPINDTVGHVLYWDTIPWITSWGSNRIDSVTSPYTHIRLEAGKTFYYRVATLLDYRPYLSEEVSAIPDSFVISDQAPKNVSATAGTNEIVLAWDSVSSASHYAVYWDSLPIVSTWSNKIDSVSSPYTQDSLETGATRYYRIVSIIGNEEFMSIEVSAIANREVFTD